MRIGIYSRYFACEATYAAMRISDWAVSRGHTVSLLSATDRPMSLSNAWDQLVVRKFDMKFTDWASQQDAVLWTHPPPKPQLDWVKSNRILTYGLAFWHELRPAHADVYRVFDKVLCPSNVCTQLLSKAWKLRNVVAVPWDSGFPFTSKSSPASQGLRVLVPMFDRTPVDMEMTAITTIERLLQHLQLLTVTVAYMPSQLKAYVKRPLARLQAEHKPRLRLIRSPDVASRPFLFHNHDLTLWMSHAEDIGIVGLQSLTMGTPVVAFKISPITEFLQDGYNGRLVPCDCGMGVIGAPIADPDYLAVEQAVLSLWSHPQLLATMEQRALQGMRERRTSFNDALGRLFP